jgi:hypothetical protein
MAEMTDHEAPDNADDLAARIWRESVDAFKLEPNNKSLIRARFMAELEEQLKDQVVIVESRETLVAKAQWVKINQRASRLTQRIINDVTTGKVPMISVEELLAEPLIVGEHRRVPYGDTSVEDFAVILDERERAYEVQRIAIVETRQSIAFHRALVERHGSIRNAFRDGSILTEAAS